MTSLGGKALREVAYVCGAVMGPYPITKGIGVLELSFTTAPHAPPHFFFLTPSPHLPLG